MLNSEMLCRALSLEKNQLILMNIYHLNPRMNHNHLLQTSQFPIRVGSGGFRNVKNEKIIINHTVLVVSHHLYKCYKLDVECLELYTVDYYLILP